MATYLLVNKKVFQHISYRKVCRYQRGTRKSKDRQRYGQKKKHHPRSTKHTHKITNRVT